ncbi:Hydrolase CocE/NonD family protein [Candidatus Sulfopaludibacter sp. SbA4]|nr:Hydrolase CocE/NonD family protein [Candidatus Sulfopaludibacter sp. SbA4]
MQARIRIAALVIAAAFPPLFAAPLEYTRRDEMVPMRDGVRLYTQVFIPKVSGEKLPFILIRTPYGVGQLDSARLNAAMPELTAEGYIFVNQDIRGRFQSEGQFVMLRQPRDPADKKAIDESTDTYDTIEWLLKNIPNHNGRVGMAGTSYGGWLTVMGMLDPHPALKAAVPQASPADMWIGDDFHHNGAFRLSYGMEYAYMMESSKEMTDRSRLIDRFDAYEWYLGLGALSNANEKYLHYKLPTWNDFVNHPDYDAFWKRQAFAPWLNRVTVPTLNVAGWWDQEDFYGPLKIYELLEKHDTANRNFLVVGPWNHGGWSRSDGQKLGRIEFGSATSEYYRREVLAPFMAYHLKGKGKLDLPEALTFRTGLNRWERHDTWPPQSGVFERKLYLRQDGKLSFDAPTGDDRGSADSYVSDPANPVPYRPRPIDVANGWTTWLVEDQRFVDHRPDVLSWETETLTQDVGVSGKIAAHLFASTSGTDSDWIVKLIDVYPEKGAANAPLDPKMSGFELMIAGDVLRGRYRNSLEKPEPVEPNSIQHYQIVFSGNDHVFLKGHRIMVQVESTWFPVIDRNPQRFVPNIFKAVAADFQPATQRIYRSARHASYLDLPVVSGPLR